MTALTLLLSVSSFSIQSDIWSRTHVLLASFFWAQYFAADHVPTPHSTEKLTDVKIYTVSLSQPPKWLGLQVNPTG